MSISEKLPGGQSSVHSSELFDRALQVMPSGYTRQMVVRDPYPLYADHAEGAWMWDVDGNKRIDFVNNFTAQIHGHGKQEIVDMVREQVARLMSSIQPTEWEIKLAELLCERVPSVERVRFMNSGTEAVLIAIKAARAYTGRPMIAKMEGGYHGQYDLIEASFRPMPDTWGDADAPASVAHNFGTPQSLLDEVLVLPLNNIKASRVLIEKHADQLSCVILDPYRVHLGNLEPSKEYLSMLREVTREHGIVLIFDEVMCLRVGYSGAQGQLGITPDLTTMGKIIGGGLPIGAVGGSREVMSVFEVEEGGPKVNHSGTFTANPMSMATGYVCMSLLTPDSFARLEELSNRLVAGFQRAMEGNGVAGIARQTGAMASIVLADSLAENYRELLATWTPDFLSKTVRLENLFLEEGVVTLRGLFVPSTPMTEQDIDFTIAAAGRVFKRLAQEYGDDHGNNT